MFRSFIFLSAVFGICFASPAFAASDICGNPYFSLKPESRIEYKNTADDLRSILTITKTETGNVDAKYTYPDQSTMNLDLGCSARTIVTDLFFDFLGQIPELKTAKVSGAFIPGDVQMGSTWTTRYDLELPSDEVDGKAAFVELNHCAVGEERIMIPAGSFNALKIRVTGYSSAPLDPASDRTGEQLIRYDLWLVKGIGILKIQYKEQGREDVIVATDIQIGNWMEKAATVAAPTIVGIAAANAAIATQATVSVDFGRYLWFFITEPLLFFKRRRRKAWGIAYNALTRLPEDLVIVRVRDAETKKILASEVTDKDGRFSFFVQDGRYTLEAAKAQFVFPSVILKHKKTDAQYADLYHGEAVKTGRDGMVLTPNIPLDPKDKEKENNEIIRQDYWHRVQEWVAFSGPVVGLAAFAVQPTAFIGGMLIFGLLVFLFFRRFATTPKPKSLGYVRDAKSGESIYQAIVRIFTLPYNKLADYKVTDSKGRYHLRVGGCEYYLTVTKQGFKQLKTQVYDNTKSNEPIIITDVIKINRE